MAKIIYLESDEEITSAVERINNIKDSEVFIVAPRGANLTQSVINLKLLKKEAQKAKKKIALVSPEATARNLAEQVGIDSHKQITNEMLASSKGEPVVHNYTEDKTEPVENEISASSGEPIAKDKKQKALDQKLPETNFKKASIDNNFAKTNSSNTSQIKDHSFKSATNKTGFLSLSKKNAKKTILITGIILTLFTAFFVIFFLLPKATLEIILKAERVDHSFDLEINKNVAGINFDNNILPGEQVFAEASGEKSGTATGKKDVGTKATGEINIINKTGINRTFVQGTEFSASGLKFVLNSATTVPAASLNELGDPVYGSKTVSVTAIDTGSDYNIGATNFTIIGLSTDLSDKVLASSSKNMSGGVKKTVVVVSENDYQKVHKALLSDLKTKAENQLKIKLNNKQSYMQEALVYEEIENKSFPAIDQEANSFKVEMKIKVSVLAFNQAEYQELVKANFEQAISDQAKVLVDSDFSGVKNKIDKNETEKKGVVEVEVSGQMWAAANMNEEDLKNSLSGKTDSEVKEYLGKYREINSFNISFSPFYVKKVPNINRNIKINLEYTQTAETENKDKNKE
jgi:hypothetical protein